MMRNKPRALICATFILVMGGLLAGCVSFVFAELPQKVTFTVEAEGTKEELYVKANIWAIKTFNQADSVIQFSDKESGTISGRYILGSIYSSEYGTYDRRATSSFVIQINDNKIAVEFEIEKGVITDDSPTSDYLNYLTISEVKADYQKSIDDLKRILDQY